MNDYLKPFMICDNIPDGLIPNEWGAFTEKHSLLDVPSIGFSWDENSVTKFKTRYGRQVIYNNFRDTRPAKLGVDVFGPCISGSKNEIILAADDKVYSENFFSMKFNDSDLSNKHAISLVNRFPMSSRVFSPGLFEQMKSHDFGPLRRFYIGLPVVTLPVRYPAVLREIDERIKAGVAVSDEEAHLFQLIDYTPIPDLEYLLLNAQSVVNGVVSFANFNDIHQMPIIPIINHGCKAGGTQKRLHIQDVFGLNGMGHDTKYEHTLRSFHDKDCDFCEPNHEKHEFFRNDYFRAFTAESPKANYEVWIAPLEHIECFRFLSKKQVGGLAEALKVVNSSLSEAGITKHRYHAFMTRYPGYEPTEFHFHVRVQPFQFVGSTEQVAYVSVVKNPEMSAVDLKHSLKNVLDKGLDSEDYTY